MEKMDLSHIKGINELPDTLTDDYIQQAIEKVDESQMTPDELMVYNWTLAKYAYVIQERKKREKIFGKEWLEQYEKNAARRIAKKYKGICDIKSIAEATGLSEEEIKAL